MRPQLLLIYAVLAGAETTATVDQSPQEHFGLHSQFIDKLGATYNVFVKDFHGTHKIQYINSTDFIPTSHFVRFDQHPNLDERNVCRKSLIALAKAAPTGQMCGSVATTLWNYLKADDYAAVKNLAWTAGSGIALNVIGNIPNYYINALLAKQSASGEPSDACGQNNDSTYASDAASSVYEFCLSIQTEKMENTATRFDAMDSRSSSTWPAGVQGMAKYFISQQAETWAPICAAYGITWKRDMLLRFKTLTASWFAPW
ncbi:GPI anchored protein [Aspergillus fumigatus Z5]|nr:GPI anchored protein [Aspergillus fumigatus Z5]